MFDLVFFTPDLQKSKVLSKVRADSCNELPHDLVEAEKTSRPLVDAEAAIPPIPAAQLF